MTDPIADMFSRIKSALNVRVEYVDIPHSVIKEKIAKIMKDEGYINKFVVLERTNRKLIRMSLKYRSNKKGVISEIKRISRPGRRAYSDSRTLPRVQRGFGTAIISTSQGVMTDMQAKAKKVGGEVLCHIW